MVASWRVQWLSVINCTKSLNNIAIHTVRVDGITFVPLLRERERETEREREKRGREWDAKRERQTERDTERMPMRRVHPCGRHADAPCAPVWASCQCAVCTRVGPPHWMRCSAVAFPVAPCRRCFRSPCRGCPCTYTMTQCVIEKFIIRHWAAPRNVRELHLRNRCGRPAVCMEPWARPRTVVHVYLCLFVYTYMWLIDWGCFYYFISNSLVVLLESICWDRTWYIHVFTYIPTPGITAINIYISMYGQLDLSAYHNIMHVYMIYIYIYTYICTYMGI